jgi:outer membrane lipoprotein-sorting protein
VEDNLNAKSAYLEMDMMVTTRIGERKVSIKNWSISNKKSFIKITYPKKDSGITFLKVDNSMWQYVPKIERIIKIPASMMLQSWMGSDFSNDDLVKESSISEDYHSKILKEDSESYFIELIPKEEATVVWGKLIMKVSKKYILPLRVEYYDEDGEFIRYLDYREVKKFNDRFFPTAWEMRKVDDKTRKTLIIVKKAIFDEKISDSYFSKRALKRYSN